MMATRKRATTLPLGTYSEGSCKAEDRIDGLLPELQRIKLLKADRAEVRTLDSEWRNRPSDDSPEAWDAERASDILEELIGIAQNYLPPYSYIGNLEGDGACFGIWADVESAQLAVSEGEIYAEVDGKDREGFTITRYAKYHGDQPVPTTERATAPKGALVLTISDHGNVTLYRSKGNTRFVEIWGVV